MSTAEDHTALKQLILDYQHRRKSILLALPSELFNEYLWMTKAIRTLKEAVARMETAEKDLAKEPLDAPRDRSPTFAGLPPPRSRVSREVYKEKLIAFLSEHGPCSRNLISKELEIPEDTLSGLLIGEKDFVEFRRGFWALKVQVEKPGTSTSPRSKEST